MLINVKPIESINTPVIMEGTAAGHKYAAVKSTLLRDGKPYIYRMGELHYSRVHACDWERELAKMKSGGIDCVASYVIWNHHEDTEGSFDFAGDRDLRRFVDICEKLDLPFFLRIGPWAHGEALYGGFPEWLVKKNCRLRTCDEEYLSYVCRYFEAVYEQLKTSKNIIGIQVENEKSDDAEYMQCLYDMLREIGFSAPFWSATAWHRAQLPPCLLPMYGGYPDAPWAGHTHKLDPNANFFFSHVREDHVIGEDLMGISSGEPNPEVNIEDYPYLTCELGAGNQNTYHRRPIFNAADIAAMAICKLGSGANGLGYYMYHGGVNPTARRDDGTLITYQESRESGYPNDCPIVSYDFQAPLGDCGQIRESYYALKEIHDFVETVGEALALMPAAFPEQMPKDLADTETVRIAVRSDGHSGFVFYNNHVHGGNMPEKTVELTIKTLDSSLTVPLTLPANESGIIPFNFAIGSERVRWVTAMPVGRTDKAIEFVPLNGVKPQVCFTSGRIAPLSEIGEIGGVKITLCEKSHVQPQPWQKLAVEQKPNVLTFEAFAHIIRLDGKKLADSTTEYEVSIPQGTQLLRASAIGNVAAAYAMEQPPRLISDHFCDGDDWFIDVRDVNLLRIKIQPLLESDRGSIYFETEMPENITELTVWAK